MDVSGNQRVKVWLGCVKKNVENGRGRVPKRPCVSKRGRRDPTSRGTHCIGIDLCGLCKNCGAFFLTLFNINI